MTPITLAPLPSELHSSALRQVYRSTPHYWQMHGFSLYPEGQAENDLKAAAETPGRTLLGIVQRVDPTDPNQGAEMIGLIDFRLHWPGETVASIGLLMVAEPYQRRGIATQSWQLLANWLATSAGILKVRLGVEQFNTAALKFFESAGFRLTGETSRVRVGTRLVRLLYMEQELSV